MIVNEESQIPLFGLDFIGILDRGTNLIEVKPLTTCNLKCKYCFVCAGDYDNNFILEPDYIIKWLKKALLIKGGEDVEVHLDPYGEFFQYKEYEKLIKAIRSLPQVKTISIQTNGTLISDDMIKRLESAGVTRLNVSFNSLDPELAKFLSGKKYDVRKMLHLFEKILKSKMDLLIAPIWFFGKNDGEIIKIIELAKEYEKMGYNYDDKFRLGIQNYLVYKMGRKLGGRVKEREFKHFYKMLGKLEKKFDIKLKLGPRDFNIHKGRSIEPPVSIGEIKRVQILSKGRNPGEFIGGLNDLWAVKVLSKFSLNIGSKINAKIIKRRRNENLITGRLIY